MTETEEKNAATSESTAEEKPSKAIATTIRVILFAVILMPVVGVGIVLTTTLLDLQKREREQQAVEERIENERQRLNPNVPESSPTPSSALSPNS